MTDSPTVNVLGTSFNLNRQLKGCSYPFIEGSIDTWSFGISLLQWPDPTYSEAIILKQSTLTELEHDMLQGDKDAVPSFTDFRGIVTSLGALPSTTIGLTQFNIANGTRRGKVWPRNRTRECF